MSYLAKANLTLSITLTTISTFLSAFLTPFIIKLYLGKIVSIDTYSILFTLIKIVILPVLAGMIANFIFARKLSTIKNITPIISKVTILIIIIFIIIISRNHLDQITPLLLVAIILHNLMGLILGYKLTSLFTKNIADQRTIAIEVGMQNSGLASILAIKHFTIASSVPAVIFSIWHNISGFKLANYWAKK